MSQPRNPMSIPETVSFLEQLYLGRFRWDLLRPFPRQDEADRKIGDDLARSLRELLTGRVDSDAVDRTGRLPDGLLDALQEHGFLKARVPTELGGLAVSQFTMFRLIEQAAQVSIPAALTLGIENSVGVGPMLPYLPEGDLRDLIAARLRQGTISGIADTEPEGAANLARFTTATQVGDEYRINGEKIHVGNAPIAELLIVSATVREDDGEHRRLFVVDTDSAGVTHTARHEFMGVKGFPNGGVRFDDVAVPVTRMVRTPPRDDIRLTLEASTMIVAGRLFMIVAPSLAIARQCVDWSCRFVSERKIDSRPLSEYEEIQRRIAESAADVFAIEAVAEWSLLSPTFADGGNPVFEQNAAKNIGSVIAGRVVDRTMSILAGEGYETASSKAERGSARRFPLERALRDVRNFRISGGVEFQLDYWTAEKAIFTYYHPDPDNLAEIEANRVEFDGLTGTDLSDRNEQHLRAAARAVRELSRICLSVARRHPDPATLAAHERPLILVSELANELLTVALVLAKAATLVADGHPSADDLADVYCTSAFHRVAYLRDQLAEQDGPHFGRLAATVLRPAEENRS
ncbi:acyl-CoA dehydrogenase family protein [Nocardia sp. BMG51109]|uniref:acyl-CoA dehydrogenase family protein n=1 Tax=Nocardia sp. BMG51109 TaxID=1056816 RepID=UPI00046402EC|nr:acyl-CoA dehydrogenase family protein [Nocardia sp. BMG51109]